MKTMRKHTFLRSARSASKGNLGKLNVVPRIDKSHALLSLRAGTNTYPVTPIALCQTHPGLFAGAAALGGGGAVKTPAAFAELPIFVGVGTADFALGGSRELVQGLNAGGAKYLTAKEYPKTEHMSIVREALPDVFAIWDAVK